MIRVKKEVEAGFGATIANRVADQLRDDIVSHRIKPGSRITAKEIADKYGVSSMPVREAFSMLCGENLLEMNPYRGATVIAVTPGTGCTAQRPAVCAGKPFDRAFDEKRLFGRAFAPAGRCECTDGGTDGKGLARKAYPAEHEVSYAGLFALCRSHGLPAFCRGTSSNWPSSASITRWTISG